MFDRQAILAQIAILEKLQGLSSEGPLEDGGETSGHWTRQATQRHFQGQLLNRLSLLTAQVQVSQSVQVEPSSGVSLPW